MSKRSTRTSTDTPTTNPAFMLPAEFAKWKAEQAAQEADAGNPHPVDSDGITEGTGIPEDDLAALIGATVPDAEVVDLDGEGGAR